ncbi:nicotinamide riboside kinase 1 [Phymastichus coffea]|uniref:nicotinamide riboside kinase 1 n=1 Tax=Phymastichus coffea TaxID=108790 RepID=UPI00273CE2AD|nr:nicotinamide riboside kinase 1 [Phymastichus coffea]
MKWLIIGIAGPTCSGKTTISNKLKKSITDSILINQDQYFLLQDDPRHTLIPELNHFNWDILSSLDMAKMYSDIVQIITPNTSSSQQNKEKKINVLIIEGFLIYNYKPIAELIDKKYFIDITKEVCWSRRKNRIYDPPDVPGYFDKCIWPEYLKHKAEIVADKNIYNSIKFFDGTKNLNELCDEIINEIKSFS